MKYIILFSETTTDYSGYYNDDQYVSTLLIPSSEWKETSDEFEENKIRHAIDVYNSSKKSKSSNRRAILLVQANDEDERMLMEDLDKYVDKIAQEKKKREKDAADAKAKAEAKVIEKKRKQLEKLQKELGMS